ncbi:MAG TPA: zf-TFIIB domain-containing protein [Gemmatimonadales bacterium]|nr:zf-TFIIB domain-containing protein [Gemmatimonadales bacterium]
MSIEKPSKNEDEYFARRDLELLEQQRAKARAEAEAAERRSHYMKCPKDGYDLATIELHGVQVDRCGHCGGIWLDAGELEAIERHHDRPGLLGRFFGDLITGIRTSHAPADAGKHGRSEPGNPLS